MTEEAKDMAGEGQTTPTNPEPETTESGDSETGLKVPGTT
jgi:hypothetical protein